MTTERDRLSLKPFLIGAMIGFVLPLLFGPLAGCAMTGGALALLVLP